MIFESHYPVLLSGAALPTRLYGTAFGANRPVPHVIDALREGYRAIDTASTRRVHNEVEDGEAVAATLKNQEFAIRRKDLFIQTKFSPAWTQAEPWPFDVGDDLRTQVFKSALRSATALQIDTLDAYLMLQPMETLAETMTVWQAMEDIYRHGGVRYLGICKADLSTLASIHEAASVKPSIVQNLFTQRNQLDKLVVDFCKAQSICYQAWGIFSDENKALAKAVMSDLRSQDFNVDGDDFQAFLRCLTLMYKYQGVMFHILDGSSNREHMRQNLSICSETASRNDELIPTFKEALHRELAKFSQ